MQRYVVYIITESSSDFGVYYEPYTYNFSKNDRIKNVAIVRSVRKSLGTVGARGQTVKMLNARISFIQVYQKVI